MTKINESFGSVYSLLLLLLFEVWPHTEGTGSLDSMSGMDRNGATGDWLSQAPFMSCFPSSQVPYVTLAIPEAAGWAQA